MDGDVAPEPIARVLPVALQLKRVHFNMDVTTLHRCLK